MKKLGLFLYLFGVALFVGSYFGKTIPTEMFSSEGREVKTWEKGASRHFILATEPLAEAVEIIDSINVPEHGEFQNQFIWERIGKLLYSIPACVGWWTILFSLLLIYPFSKNFSRNKILKFSATTGGIFMLIAVPLLAFKFYRAATVYEPYFHLSAAAYLIGGAYLLIGTGILLLLKTNGERKDLKIKI